MTNLAKPAKMSNTAFFATLPFFSPVSSSFSCSPRFSSILLDSPRFSSILLDFPRFSSILLDFPRFSWILDSPRFFSILLDSPRLFSIAVRWQEQHKFCNMRHFFAIFHFWGPFFPTTGHFAHFEPFSSKNCKIVFFLQKVPLCIIFGPLPQKLATLVVFAQMDLSLGFFLPKVAKLPVFVPEQLFWTIRVESASFFSISIFF